MHGAALRTRPGVPRPEPAQNGWPQVRTEVLSAKRNEAASLFLKTNNFAAALMMGEGPPRSVCRHRSQTTQCCCGSKGHGGEQLRIYGALGRQVCVEKVNRSKPDRGRIVIFREAVKTAEVRSS